MENLIWISIRWDLGGYHFGLGSSSLAMPEIGRLLNILLKE